MADTAPDSLGDKLIAAAAEVFAEQGYDRATVAEIARRAGVTTGAIYSRYRGKADLLAHALGEPVADQIDRLLPVAPDDALGLLEALGVDLLEPHDDDWILFEAVPSGRRDARLGDVVAHRFAEGEHRLAKIIQQAKDAGTVDPDLSTAALAQLALSIGFGMQLRRLVAGDSPDPDDWRRVIERVIDAARPPTDPSPPPEPRGAP